MLIFGICLEKPKQKKTNSFRISVDLRHRVDLRTILKDYCWWSSGNTDVSAVTPSCKVKSAPFKVLSVHLYSAWLQ